VHARTATDNNAVRLHEIGDRVSLAQELGVRGDRKAILRKPFIQDRRDLTTGPHRNGGLSDDCRKRIGSAGHAASARAVCPTAENTYSKVGALSTFSGRGSDRDEEHLNATRNRLLDINRKNLSSPRSLFT